MTDPDAEWMAVYDRAADTYDEVIPYFRTFGERLVELVDVRAGDRVLDVAAGRGACALPAARRAGVTGWVAAQDLSPEMVSALQHRIRDHGITNVDVGQGNAQYLSASSSYDVVTCGFALFLMPEPERAALGFRRALRSGGRCAVSTPAGETDPAWDDIDALFARHMNDAGIPKPPEADEPFDAASILADAGFTDIRVVTESATFAFPDPDAWWRWTWTMGWRLVLQQLSPKEQERLRREATDRLLPLVGAGGLEMTHATTYTVATVP